MDPAHATTAAFDSNCQLHCLSFSSSSSSEPGWTLAYITIPVWAVFDTTNIQCAWRRHQHGRRPKRRCLQQGREAAHRASKKTQEIVCCKSAQRQTGSWSGWFQTDERYRLKRRSVAINILRAFFKQMFRIGYEACDYINTATHSLDSSGSRWSACLTRTWLTLVSTR